MLTLAALSVATPAGGQASGPTDAEAGLPRPDSPGRVVLLGTGTPGAEPERSGPAVAVVVSGVPYLVDMGPGIVRRANAAFERGIEGLSVDRLTRVFVTHLHSDHTAGFADLMLTPWVLGRSEPLRVWGPPGIGPMAEHLRRAYRRDIHIRRSGPNPANPRGCRIETHQTEPGIVHRDPRIEITAFPVLHGRWPHAYGYRFDTGDRIIVISGDTRPSPTVIDACRGCDVLVHEVYSEAAASAQPRAWRRYHATFHTSGPQLGRLAAAAQPDLLVLYHQLTWGRAAREQLLSEVKRHFDGRVVYGDDLDVF